MLKMSLCNSLRQQPLCEEPLLGPLDLRLAEMLRVRNRGNAAIRIAAQKNRGDL